MGKFLTLSSVMNLKASYSSKQERQGTSNKQKSQDFFYWVLQNPDSESSLPILCKFAAKCSKTAELTQAKLYSPYCLILNMYFPCLEYALFIK